MSRTDLAQQYGLADVMEAQVELRFLGGRRNEWEVGIHQESDELEEVLLRVYATGGTPEEAFKKALVEYKGLLDL